LRCCRSSTCPRRGERVFRGWPFGGVAQRAGENPRPARRVANVGILFKGKDIDIPTVAQKLNVATILEGSVGSPASGVRITAQLIQVATDSHLWSDTYDRELDDIFAVQDDIAQSVVKELRAALLGEGLGAVADAKARPRCRQRQLAAPIIPRLIGSTFRGAISSNG
jgi:hypothetical protein